MRSAASRVHGHDHLDPVGPRRDDLDRRDLRRLERVAHGLDERLPAPPACARSAPPARAPPASTVSGVSSDVMTTTRGRRLRVRRRVSSSRPFMRGIQTSSSSRSKRRRAQHAPAPRRRPWPRSSRSRPWSSTAVSTWRVARSSSTTRIRLIVRLRWRGRALRRAIAAPRAWRARRPASAGRPPAGPRRAAPSRAAGCAGRSRSRRRRFPIDRAVRASAARCRTAAAPTVAAEPLSACAATRSASAIAARQSRARCAGATLTASGAEHRDHARQQIAVASVLERGCFVESTGGFVPAAATAAPPAGGGDRRRRFGDRCRIARPSRRARRRRSAWSGSRPCRRCRQRSRSPCIAWAVSATIGDVAAAFRARGRESRPSPRARPSAASARPSR